MGCGSGRVCLSLAVSPLHSLPIPLFSASLLTGQSPCRVGPVPVFVPPRVNARNNVLSRNRYGEIAGLLREPYSEALPPSQAVCLNVRHGSIRRYCLAERLGGFAHTLAGVFGSRRGMAQALALRFNGFIQSVALGKQDFVLLDFAVDFSSFPVDITALAFARLAAPFRLRLGLDAWWVPAQCHGP